MKKNEYEVMRRDVFEVMIEEMKKEDNSIQIIIDKDDDSKILIKKKNRNFKKIQIREKQVHTPKDRDIKIESIKVDDIGVKLIYHRKSNNEKEYRIFLSKKIDGKLKRIRLRNEDVKKIESSEKEMIEYLRKIQNNQIKIEVK